MGRDFDDLPDDAEGLQDMLRAAKLQLKLDVRQATLGIIKKAWIPNRLTRQEKAELVDALMPR